MNRQVKLVCLHGWGQSAQVWYQQEPFFADFSPIIPLNLPGHGGADDVVSQDWVTHLAQQIQAIAGQKPVLLLGWSLGGQLALLVYEALKSQQLIQGLVLVSSTPCFRQQPDWQWGCEAAVWQSFQQAAAQQDMRLMQRFFQMMLAGDVLTRKEIQSLAKQAVQRENPPSAQGLDAGLHFLSEVDMRHQHHAIDVPTLVMHGEQDVIVPIQAGQYFAEHIPHASWVPFQDCGHAPFLTQSAAFNRELMQWWKNISM